jgi:cobalt-zinc-cadmium efflux system outer membrane protein
LSLAQAVDQARRESPLRASAASRAAGAERAGQFAGRPFNPTIDLRVENLGPRDLLAPPRDAFAVVSQAFELGGKRAARRDLAASDTDLAALAYKGVDRQLVLTTARAYMRALGAREAVQTLGEHRDGLTTLVTTMRRRVEEGFGPEADLLRFEAEAARLQTDLARTRVELIRALAELTMTIGSPVPILPAQLSAPAPLVPPAQLSDAGLAAAVAARPDVRFARAQADKARRAATLEQLRRVPDPVVSAGYKRTQGRNTAVAGVSIPIPFFERNGQARASAEAEARASAIEERAVRERAVMEARAAVEAAELLAERAAAVERELLAPAEGVRNAARATFREGATDVLKLVDAERVYADLRREALALQMDASIAALDAYFALGQEDIP